MRKCTECQELKPDDSFYYYKGKYVRKCRSCIAAHQKRWRENRPEYGPEYQRKHRKHLAAQHRKRTGERTLRAIELYGGKCQVCGNTDIRLFQFHHVNGTDQTPNRDRRNKAVGLILRTKRPLPEIMLLCANCHIIQDFKDRTNTRGRRMQAALEEKRKQHTLL